MEISEKTELYFGPRPTFMPYTVVLSSSSTTSNTMNWYKYESIIDGKLSGDNV